MMPNYIRSHMSTVNGHRIGMFISNIMSQNVNRASILSKKLWIQFPIIHMASNQCPTFYCGSSGSRLAIMVSDDANCRYRISELLLFQIDLNVINS
jgi:hypothetical protein